ncbi:hypothetical protein, partial [Streptomyces aureocirculatus]|uniref:hypothetical protein n=1 Tax=Streptomyces aureocirculatus TaxID=67275 RepID=UPI0004C5F807
MEHISAAEALTLAAHAAGKQGPGNLLRVVLIVMVVGCVLVAWLLLRGYRQGSERQGSGGKDAPSAGGGSRDAAVDRAAGDSAGGTAGGTAGRAPSGGSAGGPES